MFTAQGVKYRSGTEGKLILEIFIAKNGLEQWKTMMKESHNAYCFDC